MFLRVSMSMSISIHKIRNIGGWGGRLLIYIYTELTRNAYSVMSHIQKIERVEADNQVVAEMADVDLDNHLLPDLVGGETLSLCLSGRVKRYQQASLSNFRRSKTGVWFDAKNTEVYQRTNLTNPRTQKFLKTVRRHKKGLVLCF